MVLTQHNFSITLFKELVENNIILVNGLLEALSVYSINYEQ